MTRPDPRDILASAINELTATLPITPGAAASPIVVELHQQLFEAWDQLVEALSVPPNA